MHTYRWNDLGFDDICWPLSSLQYLNREFSQHVPSSPTAHINTHLTLSPKVAAASQSLNWDEQHFKTWGLGPRGLAHTCTLELDKKEKKRKRKRKREEKEREKKKRRKEKEKKKRDYEETNLRQQGGESATFTTVILTNTVCINTKYSTISYCMTYSVVGTA